ncbi:isopenicillin N synthase family dioxygenase [Neptunicoccus cionae]|uniref:2-oxoglutarate-dependent ethylene/succinate-forming enzyme n=1 Tax=Neptunicoccus cionae TaxID=2035344 RepID=A0A916QXW4_9RHOB|nr:isopenicillin N synthase family oxygenase [Amylibacter cionae]GGA16816.1 2OG-Fe(II) oxygenase [Amylibacter cionae]
MTEFAVLAVSPSDPDAPEKFAKSLRETGFAVIKDHDIDMSEIEAMYDVWPDYFASEDKQNDATDMGDPSGYFGYKSENAKGAAQKDLKEFYHVYQKNDLPEGVSEVTKNFHNKMVGMGKMLLGWLDQVTPDDVKDQLSMPFQDMIKDSDSHLLRVLHYPPLPDDVQPGEVRAAAHGDINLITLLVTGSEPGLQAQDVNGNWHDIPCGTGYINVNAGDMLERASRQYYPSTIHRVVNPPKQENKSRYSLPLFMHPRPDVQLDHQTAGEFLEERLKEIGQRG